MITRIYFDTSVYVKHFKNEDGSDNVKRIIQIADKNRLLKVFMSLWTINESVNAIDKNYHQRKLVSSEERDKIIATILDTSRKYLQTYPNIVFVPLTSSIIRDSTPLIISSHISADDALHVQTAAKWRCKYFLYHDRHLKRVPKMQAMTMMDITNSNDMRRLFNELTKYEILTHEEYRDKALKGEICAACRNLPIYKCPKCSIHYCHEHVKNHKHVLSNEEVEQWHRESESLR